MRSLLLHVGLAAACTTPAQRKVELIEAPPAGAVEPIIAGELAIAAATRESLVVYVGASWCEPCKEFHAAASAGELDADLGGLRLLMFDADRDGAALETAGYRSRLIPLFAVPRADGRASGKQFEGAIKDRAAVPQIVPRLERLLSR